MERWQQSLDDGWKGEKATCSREDVEEVICLARQCLVGLFPGGSENLVTPDLMRIVLLRRIMERKRRKMMEMGLRQWILHCYEPQEKQQTEMRKKEMDRNCGSNGKKGECKRSGSDR